MPAVGDRAAGRDRQPLRARPAAQLGVHPVPGDPRPQLAELLGRIPARQHVQHRVQRRVRQPGERRRPPHQRRQLRRPSTSPSPPSRRCAAPARPAGCAGTARPRSRRPASVPPPPRTTPGRRGTSGTSRPATPRRPGDRRGRRAAARTRPTAAPPPAPPGRPRPCRCRAPATTSPPRTAAARTSDPPRQRCAAPATSTRGARGRPTRSFWTVTPDCPMASAGNDASLRRASSASSFSRAVSRSASRREFANTIVDRCARTSSRIRASTDGQIDVRCSAPAADPDTSPVGWPSSDMSSTGTSTSTWMVLGVFGCTTVTGRPPARNVLISSTGRTVADNPIRCAGRSSNASSRSSDNARCAPRLVPATACTSSTITVSTPRNDSRADDVSSRNNDSGVVTSTSGGVRPNARRSSGGRVAGAHAHGDGRLGQPQPVRGLPDAGQRRAQVPLDVHRQRLQRRHVEHPAAPPGLRR